MILAAFYAAAEGPQPMNMVEVVAYVWLGQALLGMLPWNTDADFKEQVASGAVAYDLLRPLDLYGYWYARTLAFRTAATTLRAIPMVVFAMLVLPAFGLAEWALPVPSFPALAGFLAAITAAALLSTSITVLAHISMLWTLSGEGVDRILPSFVTILSGMIVPLPLFPDWMQPFLSWQPFRGLCDVPYRIYSGNIPIAEAANEIVFTLGVDGRDRLGQGGSCSRAASAVSSCREAEGWQTPSPCSGTTSVSRSVPNCSTGHRSCSTRAGQFANSCIEFLGIWALFDRFGHLAGWTLRGGRISSTASSTARSRSPMR